MKRAVRAATALAIVGTVAAQLLGLLGRHFLIADIFNHFIFGYCLVLVIGLVAVLAQRRVFLSTVAGVALIATSARILFFYLPMANTPSQEAPTLRIMIANVNYENRQYGATLDLIEQWEDPDILLFPEFMQRWDDALEPIEARYPYTLRTGVGPKNYGIAVYSKRALQEHPIDECPILEDRVVVGSFERAGTTTYLVVVHPRSVHTAQRNQHLPQMRAINELLQSLPGPLILAGDFNSTPWSPNMRAIRRGRNLADCRQGHGAIATWPVPFAFLPIDGCFASKEFVTTNYLKGPQIESDHYPILVTLR